MLLLSTAYLPPVAYVSALHRAGQAGVEYWEHYTKQTIRNRCAIAGAGGLQLLSIPVEKAAKDEPICRRRISNHGNWRHLHWQALKSAYGSSPFFEFYEDDFAPFFQPGWEFLTDFNADLTAMILGLLDVEATLQPTAAFCGAPATDFPAFEARPYYQVFAPRVGFLPNLSIVDLLFNMGPESIFYL